MLIQVELARILIQETDDTHIVELREKDGERVMPITIGFYEAAAIERRLLGHLPPRPLTHELMSDIIAKLGAEIEKIVISDLQEHTFFAKIVLKHEDLVYEIDSRPSDAIALGVASEVPIFVAEQVLEDVSKPFES
ncbi:bifunctional nuclease family protein [Poriferisphaera sp. WC338]|uniref:bifunctional nuclease family protein n=1 Tax=Poriferisphaera sp. WC338 TaxID=3425129 RepID=UPI003D819D6E